MNSIPNYSACNAFPINSIDNDDDETVVTSNRSDATHGLLDSGASDNFFMVKSQLKDQRPTSNPITVVIPDGRKMKSTEEGDADWPSLPENARSGHIIPSIKSYALISVVKLCDAGCEVIFRHNCCLVLYNNKIVLYGVRCPRTRLWMVPLTQKQSTTSNKNNTVFTKHHTNSIHHMENQKNLIEYLHQCFFLSPC